MLYKPFISKPLVAHWGRSVNLICAFRIPRYSNPYKDRRFSLTKTVSRCNCQHRLSAINFTSQNINTMSDDSKEKYSKEELKKRLTPMQYHVTQEKGTERYHIHYYHILLMSVTTTNRWRRDYVVQHLNNFRIDKRFVTQPKLSPETNGSVISQLKNISYIYTLAE